MTVTTENSGDQYVGNGSRTFFEFSFDTTYDFSVWVSVDGQNVEGAYSIQGGGILFNTAPENGAIVKIWRLSDVIQPLDFEPYEAFPAAKSEAALDRLIIIKQEAVEFRALVNLRALQAVTYVSIENTQGDDAVIPLWSNDLAGMFAGEVNQDFLPAANSFDEKENYVYMSFELPVPTTTRVLVVNGGSLYYVEMDYENETSTVFDELTGVLSGSYLPITSDGTRVILEGNSVGTVDVVSWDGAALVVEDNDVSIPNTGASPTHLFAIGDFLFSSGTYTTGSWAIGRTHQMTFDPAAFSDENTYNGSDAGERYVRRMLDIRDGGPGTGYGDKYIATCEWQLGLARPCWVEVDTDLYEMTFSENGAEVGTSYERIGDAFGWDRDNAILYHANNGGDIKKWSWDPSDGTLQEDALTISVACNAVVGFRGYLVTGEGLDVNVYSLDPGDGVTTTLEDTLDIDTEYSPGGSSPRIAWMSHDPVSEWLWVCVVSDTAREGRLICVKVDDDGNITNHFSADWVGPLQDLQSWPLQSDQLTVFFLSDLLPTV